MASEQHDIAVRFVAVDQEVVTRAYEVISAASLATEKRITAFDKATAKASKEAEMWAEKIGRAKQRVARADEAAAREAERAAERVVRANERTAKASERAAAAMDRGSTMAFSRSTKAIGVFSLAASSAGDQLGKFGTGAMRVAETFMAFGAYLGTPWGLAVGGGVAAVSLLTGALNSARDAAVDARVAQVQYAQAAALDAQTRQERQQTDPYLASLADRADASALAAGVMSPDEAQAAAEARFGQFAYGARPDMNKGGGKAIAPMPNRYGGPSLDEEMRLKRLSEESAARSARYSKMGAADPGQKAAEDRAKVEKQFTDQRIERERDASITIVEIERDRLDKIRQMEDEAAAHKRQVASDVATATASVGLNAIHELIKGHKMSARAFLSSLGDQIWAMGQGHVLQALAMTFIPWQAPFAGGLAAAGAAEMAFGGILGAATAGGGSKGGGGARGSAGTNYAGGYTDEYGARRRDASGSAFLDRTRAESPSAGRYSNAAYGSHRTINVYTPSVIRTTADDARVIKEALREGERHGV